MEVAGHEESNMGTGPYSRCGASFNCRLALSRADGRTEPIRPDCGTREALESIGVVGYSNIGTDP